MKLHSIQIENIASLKGKHSINFDELSKVNNSIFAITGDTGSGKSTILNCISLALYGQTYKKSLNQYDYITLGEQSGSINLNFSQNGQQYLAVWECRVRKKNGEFLKSPKSSRSYFEITGNEQIATEKSPELILGLDFDQFCQTIILNQGEFARFLSSSFSDRKIILEKLYKADKLKLLNPTLRSKINNLIKSLDIIDSKLETFSSSIEVIDHEELVSLKETLKLEKQQLKIISSLKSISVDLSKLAQNHAENQSRIELESRIIEKVLSKKNDIQIQASESLERLEEYKKNSKNELPKLYKAKEINNIAIATKATIENESLKHKKFTEQLQNEEKKRDKISEDESKCKKEINDQYQSLSIDKSFQFKKDKIIDLKNSATKLTSEFTLCTQTKEQSKKAISEVKAKVNKIKNDIKNLETQLKLSERSKLEATKEQLENDLKRQLTLSPRIENLIEYQVANNKEANALSKFIESLKISQINLNKHKEETLISIADTKDALAFNQLKNYKEVLTKKSLIDKACFVCANTEISHLEIHDDKTDDKSRIVQLNEKLENFNAISNKCDSDIIRNNDKLAESRDKINNLKEELERRRTLVLGDDAIKETKAVLKQTNTFINRLQHQITIKDKELIDNINLQNQLIDSKKSLDEYKISLSAKLLDHKKIENQHQNLISSANHYLVDFKDNTSLSQLKVSATVNILDIIFQILDVKQSLKYIQSSLEQTSINIQDKKDLVDSSKKAIIQSKKKLFELESELSTLTQDRDINQSIKKIESNLKRLELDHTNTKQKLKEHEVEYSASKAKINTFTEQHKSIASSFISSHKNFTDIALESFLAEVPLYSSLKDTYNVDELSVDLFISITKDLEIRSEALQAGIETKTKIVTEKDLLVKKANDTKEKTNQLQSERLELYNQKCDWEKLYTLLGRDEFRNFVLSYVEKMLIIQTNSELENLYDGRYELKQFLKESKTSPEFYIIDKLHGGSTRKVSTLSGGETFMVSLAMAFALAELTRGDSQIDSFFIDEGFGTLDEDSIDDVLETLQEIETRGKQVGLISHVKSMTQRIPVNINLSKNASGSSTIEIKYN